MCYERQMLILAAVQHHLNVGHPAVNCFMPVFDLPEVVFALYTLAFKLLFGGEPDTSYNVNMSLITRLFHLDALASDSYLGFTPERDQGDPDSIMASLSETTASLRPDGVLRGRDGQKLLMKWEERADVLAEAIADLKRCCAIMSSVHMCSLCYHVLCPYALHLGHCIVA